MKRRDIYNYDDVIAACLVAVVIALVFMAINADRGSVDDQVDQLIEERER